MVPLVADVTKASECEIVAAAKRFGRLDILVNNAALTRDGLAMRMKREDWDAVLQTNLTGAHLCIQQALPPMMKVNNRDARRSESDQRLSPEEAASGLAAVLGGWASG